MPNKTFKIYLTILILGGLGSCNPCRNADALVSDYQLRFQLVDKSTGDNLLFGPSAELNLEEIKLYSLSGTDTLFYPLIPSQNLGWVSQEGDVYTEIYPPASDIFLQYPDKSQDTLFLTFSQRETECWGLITSIKTVTRNQTEFFENTYETLIFSR